MRHRAKGRQLSRTSSHRRAMLNNMASSLFEHGRVVTTEAKAKELRPFAEKLITLARRGDLHARRLVERQDQGSRHPGQALRRDRAPVRGPSRRLYPDPQAGTPLGRRRGHRADRVARRVTAVHRAAETTKGTLSGPLFLDGSCRSLRRRAGPPGAPSRFGYSSGTECRRAPAGAPLPPGPEPSADSGTSGVWSDCSRD